MYSKDDVLAWFKSSTGSTRIDLLSRLFRFCSPLELRFIAVVLEDACRRDHHELQSIEHHVNTATLFADNATISLHEKATRRRLLTSLALLRSDNQVIARRLFEQLMLCLTPNGGLKDNVELYEEGLLLLLMAANHPAFLFDERQQVWKRIEQLTAGSEVVFAEVSRVDSAKQSETAFLKKIDVRDVQQRPYSKNYEYRMEVTWSDGTASFVYKTHQELFDFQNRLLDRFPNEGGKKNRIIPFLPGKRFLARSKELADKRLPEIGEYARKLVQLPPKISKCQLVLDFFSNEEQKSLKRQQNVLSDALADMAIASLEQPVAEPEDRRQNDAVEPPAGSGKSQRSTLESSFTTASDHTSQSATASQMSPVLPHPSASLTSEGTPSLLTTRGTFVPHLQSHPLARHRNPPPLTFLQQPGFPMQQPHMQFMRLPFHQQLQPNVRQNHAATNIHGMNFSLHQPVMGMARPQTVAARPRFRPPLTERDIHPHHNGSNGSINRVHSMPRNSRNEVSRGSLMSSSSLPASPTPSPVLPSRLGGSQPTSAPSSRIARTPSPSGRQRRSSSTSSSPGLLQDPSTITSLFDWLKALRLHKYFGLLEKMTYEEMLALTDEDMEKMKITDGPRRKLMKELRYLKSQGFKGFDSGQVPFRTSTSQWSLDSDSLSQHGGCSANATENDFNDIQNESCPTSPTHTAGSIHHTHTLMSDDQLNEEPTFMPDSSTGALSQMEEAATFVLQVHPQSKGNLVSFAGPVMIDSMPVPNNELPVTHPLMYPGAVYGHGLAHGGAIMPGSEYGPTFHVMPSLHVDPVVRGYPMPHQVSCYKCGQQGHLGPDCTNIEGSVSHLKEFTLSLSGPDKEGAASPDSVDS